MSQPWENDPIVSAPQPQQFPGIIQGAPKAPDPVEAERLRLAQEAEARAQRGEQRQQNQEIRTQQTFEGTAGKPAEGDKKAAGFLIRALGSNAGFEATGDTGRNIFAQVFQDSAPDLSNSLFNSDARQVSDAAQKEFIAAVLRLDSGAAIPIEEETNYKQLYFPRPGDGEEVLEYKRQARQRAIANLRLGAGPLADEAQQAFDALQAQFSTPTGAAREPETKDVYKNGVQFNIDKPEESFDRSEYLRDNYGMEGDDEAKAIAFWNVNRGNTSLTPDMARQWYQSQGIPAPDEAGLAGMVEGVKAGREVNPIDTSAAKESYETQLDGAIEAKGIDPESYTDTIRGKGSQGITLGLSDELRGGIGAAGALLTGDNPIAAYGAERDIVRRQNERSEAANPGTSLGAELAGGLATGGVGARRSIAKGGMTLGRAAKEGAAFGGVGGFGYGEGLEGSAVNALGGTVLGAGTGAIAQKAGNALVSQLSKKAANKPNANALAAAGEAEGVTVNRAMANPQSNNAVSKSDATLLGGPQLQAGMKKIEGQIEGRVGDLGRGGRPMVNTRGVVDETALGSTGTTASERAITKTGKIAKAKYDRAVAISDGAKVEPKTALTETDELIKKLSETPEINAAEIKFLKGIRSDLAGESRSATAPKNPAVKVAQTSSKKWDITHNGEMVGFVIFRRDSPMVGLSGINEFERGKGLASSAYDAIEAQIGRRILPDIASLSKPALSMWKKRIAGMPAADAKRVLVDAKKMAMTKEEIAGAGFTSREEAAAAVNSNFKALSEFVGQGGGSGLSVDALRKMRTTLRKKVNGGDLVFGESEARVLSIMDKAADDIRVGLTAQGKGKAARAFESADKAYRARMDYITNTLQPLVGKRNANLSSEQVARKLQSLATKDEAGLRKFYASLTPDEAADVAATFAFDLGKNNKNNFTVTQFLRQSDNLSDDALRTLFGKQGAESVGNLRIIGKEVERVTGSMNSRTSKSGVANFRDWVYSMALAGGGAVQGGLSTAAVVGGLGVAGTAGKQIFTARSLMSPKITRWILTAPKTSNPRAIDSHFAKLGQIAKAEPALAGEIEILQRNILTAANDNASRMSAVAENVED